MLQASLNWSEYLVTINFMLAMITLILLSGESLEISFEHETHVCYHCRNIFGEIPINIL